MILEAKENSFFDLLPFSPIVDNENKTVSFSEGFIFDCFNNQPDSAFSFSNGARRSQPRNINEVFSYGSGDKFYLIIEGNISESFIGKEGEMAGTNLGKFNIPLWQAPENDNSDGEQFLSENVFIQDVEAGKITGLSIRKTLHDESGPTYRLNSGYLSIPALGVIERLDGFEFKIGESESIKKFAVKFNISAEIGPEDTYNNADLAEISNLNFVSASIEEYSDEPEDLPIQLSSENQNLNGIYYLKIDSLETNGNRDVGNITLLPRIETVDRKIISPAIFTEVRGINLYKNGVSTDTAFRFLRHSLIPEDERGFYKQITIIRKFKRFAVGINGVTVELSDHVKTTVLSVEAGPNAIEEEPILIVDTTSDEIAEDEFIVSPHYEDEYSFTGGEISEPAMSEAITRTNQILFTPLDDWNGDFDVANRGAGKDGSVSKAAQKVQYGERRYKTGGLFEDIDLDPQSVNKLSSIIFTTFSREIDEDGNKEDSVRSVKFDIQKGYFIEPTWSELEIKEEGVYNIEQLIAESEVQSDFNNYSFLDITKPLSEYYQKITFQQ